MTITVQETQVINNLVLAWNNFLSLPVLHPDDTDEFRHHIHALQHMIFARQAIVEFNEKNKRQPPKFVLGSVVETTRRDGFMWDVSLFRVDMIHDEDGQWLYTTLNLDDKRETIKFEERHLREFIA